MPKFKTEDGYIVLKLSDVHQYLPQPLIDHLKSIAREVEGGRVVAGIQPLQCVVVERDWPEYDQTLAAIEARIGSKVFK